MEHGESRYGALLGWNSGSAYENLLDFKAEALKDIMGELIGHEGCLPDDLVSLLKERLGYETKGISFGQPENERAGLADLLDKPEAVGIATDFLQERYRFSSDTAMLIAKVLLKLLGEEPAKRKSRKKPSPSSKKTAEASASARQKRFASPAQQKGKTSSPKRSTASSSGKKTASTTAKKSTAYKADRTAASKKASKSTASRMSGSSRTGRSKPSGQNSASKMGKPRPSSRNRLQTTESTSE